MSGVTVTRSVHAVNKNNIQNTITNLLNINSFIIYYGVFVNIKPKKVCFKTSPDIRLIYNLLINYPYEKKLSIIHSIMV